MSLRHRVVSGLGANAINQMVTIGIQLVSLPVFLAYWSVPRYGTWLILSAVPSYFSLADAGLTTVAGNNMTMMMARQEYRRANAVFQTAIVTTTLIVVAVMLVATPIIWWIADLGSTEKKLALTCLIAVALLNISGGLFDAAFRASGAYAAGTVALAGGRLIEWCGGLLGLSVYGTMAAVAGGSLIARLAVTVALVAYSRSKFPTFRWGVESATREDLRSMLIPALSFLAFPIGLALSLQGMTLLVGYFFGPTRLTLFNTYRTLSRTLVQVAAVLSRALWSEISRYYGAGEAAVVARLYQRGTEAAALVCVAAAAVLLLAGKFIIGVWTHHKIEYDSPLFAAFVVVALINCFWQVGLVVISATNNHQRFSWAFLFSSAASVALAALLARSTGLLGCVAALGCAEVGMLILSRRTIASILGAR
jgi:O-antigen/teichoic acid export membrane protein